MRIIEEWDSNKEFGNEEFSPIISNYLALFKDVEGILRGLIKKVERLEIWAKNHQERELEFLKCVLDIFRGK